MGARPQYVYITYNNESSLGAQVLKFEQGLDFTLFEILVMKLFMSI